MAQQITNSSSIMDSLATKKNNFVDIDNSKFDSILDIANKSIAKQDNIISENKSKSSTSNSQTLKSDLGQNANIVQTVSTVRPSNETNVNSNTTNLSNIDVEDTPISSINDTNSKDISSNDTKEDLTNGSSTDVTDLSTTEIQDDTVVNIENQKDTTVNEEISQNEDKEAISSVNNSDILSSVVENVDDTISKYTYLENNLLVENTNTISEDTENDTNEDIDIDLQAAMNTEDIDVSTSVIDLKALKSENTKVDDSIEVKDINVSDLSAINNVVSDDLISKIEVENENVNVVANLNSDVDVQVANNSKELISQKMIDELDVKITDIVENNDIENTNSSEELSLMNSTEQAVKYSMEQNVDSQSVELDNIQDIKPVKVDDEDIKLEESEEIEVIDVPNSKVLEDISEETDNIVAKPLLVSENSNSDDELTSEYNEVEVESSTAVDESANENNASGDDSSNSKDELRKENVLSNTKDEKTDFDVTANVSDEISGDIKNSTINPILNATKTETPIVGSVSNTQNLSAQTTSMTQATNISKEDIIAQIHNKLQAMNSNTNTKLTMVLNPESLGKVSVQLTNTKDGVTAEMLVSSQTVKDLLDDNITTLKDTLSAQGVNVNEVSVKVSESKNNAEMDYTEQENSNSNSGEDGQSKKEEKDENKFDEMFSKNIEEEHEDDIN